MPDTIFARILRKEIPANLVHEDESCIAFHDIHPQAPVHVLVIPRKALSSMADATSADELLLGHLLCVARDIARKLGLEDEGYRLVVNNGPNAGQTVFHLHVHLLGGRVLNWPPG